MQDLAFIIGTTLMYSTPLLFTALGGTISENSGVINIGLEGMMYLGAFVGAAVGFYANDGFLGFLAAGIVSGLLALLHAVACVTFQANHIVSGIAINFLGPGIALFFSRLVFDGATHTRPIPLDKKIARPVDFLFQGDNGIFARNSVLDTIFNQYATVYLSLLAVFLVWVFLYKTKIGLRIRLVGEHPKAAETLGVSVVKLRYLCVVLSGVLAGFGGAAMSTAIVSSFTKTLISGQGFIALAAMIFGKWKPQGALLACLLFGAAQGLVVYLGGKGIPVSSYVLSMLPYIITIIVLIVFVGKGVAPTALGKSSDEHY